MKRRAYLDLSPAVVRYRVPPGLSAEFGRVSVQIENRIISKVSRGEVATRFLSPASAEACWSSWWPPGTSRKRQAALAARVPMCDDLTAEADSGGHTDNRPAITLLPATARPAGAVAGEVQFPEPGAAGTGRRHCHPRFGRRGVRAGGGLRRHRVSINQACRESGSSDVVRAMLAQADPADVIMAPAADMFEMGVKVQVLKRGTMFPMRAQKLFDLYRAHAGWEAIPPAERTQIEKTLFRRPV